MSAHEPLGLRLHRLRLAMFAALAIPNYRRYFYGQSISLVGTWMQSIAQSYLVFQLTHSSTDLGVVVALQTLPVLLLGPYGGVVADRVDKRRLMIALQSVMGLLALALGVLTLTGRETVMEIGALAVLLGLNNCFENPARQAFVLEMVGPENVRNAVTLNSVTVNAARAVGPAVAGILIATAGYAVCFLLNAASFAAVVASLWWMDLGALQPSRPAARGKGQLREGLRYVARTRDLAVPLVMMAVVGCLAYEFQVSLPVVAQRVFHGGSVTYGFMTATMGVGAVVGGLWSAARGRTGTASLVRSSLVFGLVIALAAVAPNLPLELVALAFVGGASVTFLSKGNSSLQLAAAPQMRGRVMALWAVAFLGSTPIGGPVIGVISSHGGRWGLATGAAACVLAGLLGLTVLRRGQRQQAAAEPLASAGVAEPSAAGESTPAADPRAAA